jgi:hypothetical protein
LLLSASTPQQVWWYHFLRHELRHEPRQTAIGAPYQLPSPAEYFANGSGRPTNKISLQVWQRVAFEVRHHFTPGIF